MSQPADSFPPLRTAWLGRIGYADALDIQHSLFERRKAGTAPDTLLTLEHEPVYTLGRRGDRADIIASSEQLRSIGAVVVETDRGGEVTYHGPGQLVMYPVISLREAELGPVSYVRILEQAVIETLRRFGISGHRVVGKTGVWVAGEPGAKPPAGANPAGRKIAAMGVRVSSGVAMHGLALNVSTDLSHFSNIVPCGMLGLDITSIEKESGHKTAVKDVAVIASGKLCELLQRTLVNVEPGALAA